jgi:hypothetical protein
LRQLIFLGRADFKRFRHSLRDDQRSEKHEDGGEARFHGDAAIVARIPEKAKP